MDKMYLRFVIFFQVSHILTLDFHNITSDIFQSGSYPGIISAFGDFNSDKFTDLFVISQNGKSVKILLSSDNAPFFRNNSLECTYDKKIITGVAPGDLNGDSMMDLLVTLRDISNNENILQSVIVWGSLDNINCTSNLILNVTRQPFLIDYNDDMIPDIMGEDEEGHRCVWLYDKTSFIKIKLWHESKPTLGKLRNPHSSSVVDLNYDMVSDLMVTSETNIEYWLKFGKGLNFSRITGYPENVNKGGVIGQSTFIDFNTDGKLDHIMPICYDASCLKSAVMMQTGNLTWISLMNGFSDGKNEWGFFKPSETILGKESLPITLRAGDFNMDSYPDFIVVLENKSVTDKPKPTKVVVLENIPCSECLFGRSLKTHWSISELDNVQNVELATFYDIYDDGVMDILVVQKSMNGWFIDVFKNKETYDAYFIKVLVLNGLCRNNDCPSGKIPYGTNQPGPMIRYNTTKSSGEPLISCAVQMSQTAHFPLHLPYSVFGLGQTPNFVDHLTVAIPEMEDDKKHEREWTQVIPNSQMVVIPHPPTDEHKWINKLFLTPSRLVLLTLDALLGTCCCVSLVILVLHWKEKLEDKKERMQDAHRFHFDAM